MEIRGHNENFRWVDIVLFFDLGIGCTGGVQFENVVRFTLMIRILVYMCVLCMLIKN